MASPYFLASLSIIPGLGMIALKEYRKGVITFGLIFLFGILIKLSNSELIMSASAGLLATLWVFQIIYTFQLGKRRYLLETKGNEIKPSPKFEIPSTLSRVDKVNYRITEQIRQQLHPGESLKFGLMALQLSKIMPAVFYQFLLGITEGKLILIQLDLMGKPLDISRYQLTEITRFKISKGVINNKVQFWFFEKKKPKIFLIFNQLHADDLELLKVTFSNLTN